MEPASGLDRRFRRSERLGLSKEIKAVFKYGKRVLNDGGKLYFYPNNRNYSRISFPLRKRYGGAVVRNRSKRLSREVYRNHKVKVSGGYDFVLMINPGSEDYTVRESVMLSLFIKAGVYLDETI